MTPVEGEHLDGAERVVVSPEAGRLRVPGRTCAVMRAGQTMATVENSGADGFGAGLSWASAVLRWGGRR